MKNVRMTIWVMVVVLSVVSIASADIFGTGGNQLTIDFVNISGDASSANGTNIGGSKTFSDPSSSYRMGTYEITNDQWGKFISSVGGTVTGDPSDAYDGSALYTGTDVPTDNISWHEGAQFVNYLNTSTGHQAAYKFTGTQGTDNYTLGVWESGDVGYDSSNPYRNSNAYYFLPTEDEWVKAAFWNGTSLQTHATKPGDTLYQGNGSNGGWNYYDYEYGTEPYGPWDVGSGSEEINGTFDMMGNAWEWMESPYIIGVYLSSSSRGVRGGSYRVSDSALSLSSRGYFLNPYDEDYDVGFRVASVPDEILGNDECGIAIPVQANEPYTGSTVWATGTDISSCADKDTNDAWHSFTANFNYEYTISLCGSDFDTTLTVFDECGGTELACNDDTDPGVCPSELQSQLTLVLEKGETCFIRIAGSKYQTGDYTMTIVGPICTEYPVMDFNNDCRVDFQDLAEFSASWLECNLDPPEVCWE